MRRQLNVKAAGLLLGIVILLGAGVAVLHSYQVVQHSAVYLRLAERAQRDNRPEQALRYFGLYLTYQPGDTDARAEYGIALEKYGDYDKALLNLDQVLRRDPTRKEVRYRLIRCLVALRRLSEAVDHAEKLLPDWDRKGELEHVLGWCCEALERYDAAALWFEKAIAADPKQIDSYALLADVLRDHLNSQGKAAEVMDALVKANPDSYQSYLLRRRNRLLSSPEDGLELAAAEQDLQRAVALAPDEPAVVLAAAESALKRNLPQEARSALARGVAAHPDDVVLVKALAQLELSDGNWKAARGVLQQGVQRSPKSWDLRLLLADLLIDLKEPALAEKQVAEMRRLNPKSPVPDYFQARFHMEKRQWPEAITLLERTRERMTGPFWIAQIQLQLGRCYQQIGDAEQQRIAFERAAKERPDLIAAAAGQGSALLALGRFDEALDFLQKAVSVSGPDKGTWVDRVLRHGPARAAVSAEVWTDLARCLMLRNLRRPEIERDWAEVNLALEQAVRRQPSSVAIVVLKAEIAMSQKKFDEARQLLEAARGEFPHSTLLACALADLVLRKDESDAAKSGKPRDAKDIYASALAVLDRAEKEMGPSADIRQARLRIWGRQASAKNREQVKLLGENLEIFSPPERARLLRDLAETWMRLSDPRTAEQFWRRLIDEQPSDVRARLSLLDLSLQQGKIDAARQIVEDLRKLEGEKGAGWHYGAAALLVAESLGPGPKLEKARKHLAECYRSRSNWSRLPLLEAQMDELEGRFDRAIGHYQEAFKDGERTPRLVIRLVKLLQERRDFKTAQDIFRTFEQQGPLSIDLARLGADLALANNNAGRAVVLARLAVPADSRDYRDYLWLARIYQADGKFDQAGELLDYALGFAPYTPEVWTANVQHLALTDRLGNVPRLLSEMNKKVPPKLQAFTQARCYELLGQFADAEQKYDLAMKERPKDFALWAAAADFFRQSDQPAKAVPLLHKLLDPSSGAPFVLQARARQQLALILASSGEKDGVARALELLSKGYYPHDDECTRYLVLGFDADKREEAVKSFEVIRSRFPISAEELFYFAKGHLAAGDTQRALTLLRELITSNPDQPQYLAQYIRCLLQAGDAEADGAAAYLEKLRRQEPYSPRTRELQAQIRSRDQNTK